MEEGHGHTDLDHHLNTLTGYGNFMPGQAWQRSLAKFSGLLNYPHDHDHEDSERSLSQLNYKFETLVKSDHPNSPCSPLKIEEFKCLSFNKFKNNPELASVKCVKWYNEWIQCKWDEDKLKFGYNYMEPRAPRKRKAYIAAPNYQYS
ncbi:hypothetical protein TpMuguga_03g00605 [Theileria parva strain Muguga]|uniref:Uncharacterized protein n=1 Tax=Theileria parva TaxID=5875 RepID=Q4N0Z2_THEPA|nr:uncharacterized protein TpMuguga_03g00605 [Theileria parva strain Muguga]EAN31350.1 hypothetical protein TpMuguga_03g00605 [Theileria parva strain Muguga]|eukprot:XP_763633.1 hypothetical protein [Theileria parva strain Muguga]